MSHCGSLASNLRYRELGKVLAEKTQERILVYTMLQTIFSLLHLNFPNFKVTVLFYRRDIICA